MVKQGIVLEHVISERGIEVDRAKVETVEKLPPPTDVKSLRSFLGHVEFYRRFVKDISFKRMWLLTSMRSAWRHSRP
jgi:hypothetical protein